jgi:spore maturation protein CgeB
MKLVIFGLTVSSSWGNGHATLWRGLCRALAERGHYVVFFERDVPYYATHRDLQQLPGGRLVLYPDWAGVRKVAKQELADADAGMVTSYCPDGVAATELLLSANGALKLFYDLDTPITLEHLLAGKSVSYIGPRGLRDFDLVFSFTGGVALAELKTRLGAQRVAPLYGSVDPAVHRPVEPREEFRSSLSYLGTYAGDRQEKLDRLFLEPARRLPNLKFLIGGAQYPETFPWHENIFFARHVAPSDHPAFFCSSRLTLNITRAAMAQMGYCPSGRLFEAAACGVPLLSDWWEGLDEFLTPGQEVLLTRGTEDTLAAVSASDAELARLAAAARERVLSEHTAAQRAQDFEAALAGTTTQLAGPAVHTWQV